MKDVKDVTSTVFGLLIAYLLPGLTAFYALSFWSSRVEAWFDRILNGDASAGLIVFIIFGAIVIGLQLSPVRSLIFEQSWANDIAPQKWPRRRYCRDAAPSPTDVLNGGVDSPVRVNVAAPTERH